MDHGRHLTKHETRSDLYNFRCSYLSPRLGHLPRNLAIDKPHRDIHGLEVVGLQGLGPETRKVLRHEGSDETFTHASQRRPGRDVPNSIILGEGKRKSWISYAKDQRPEPKTR